MGIRLCLLPFVILIYLTPSSIQIPVPEDVSQYKLALETIFATGIRLQTFLRDDNSENFLSSPISATVILAQLLLGTKGHLQKKLVDLIQLPNSTHHVSDQVHCLDPNNRSVSYPLPYATFHLQLAHLLKALETKNSSIAKDFILKENSAVFLKNGIRLTNDYYKHLTKYYSTDIYSVDFLNQPQESQMFINNWALKNTNGKIASILDQPPSPTTAAIFANAIYFLADWEMPFDDTLNRFGQFNVTESKKVNVTYMIGLQEHILYAEADDYRVISIPYKNEELGMYVLLPKHDSKYVYDIKGFAQNLKSNEILETLSNAKRRDVVLKMPKMELTHTFSIMNNLKKYLAFKRATKRPVADENKVPTITTRINNRNKIDALEGNVQAFNNFTSSVNMNNSIFLNNATAPDGPNLRISDIIQQVSITVNEKGTEAAAVSSSTIDYIGGSKNFLMDRPFVFFIRHEATQATLFWGTIGNPVA